MAVDPQIDRALRASFLEALSHELRTPLSLQLSPLEEALADEEDPLPPRQRERVAFAHRSGQRLRRVVTGLLDLARVELGLETARFESTDLAELTRALVDAYRPPVEQARLTLDFSVDGSLVDLEIDRAKWSAIVLHLLSNALKVTFDGGITVALRREDHRVKLVVSDTGEGFAACMSEKLFAPLERIEGQRCRSEQGLGLGLALARVFARLHGGRIEARSEPGRGAAFTVELPAVATPRVARAGARFPDIDVGPCAEPFLAEAARFLAKSVRPVSRHQGAREAMEGHCYGRILLVDDNPEMRAYVTSLLAPTYDVEATSNGEAALAAARAHPPDLVLSDLVMPGLDGLALLEALRADPVTRATPFIFLSASVDAEVRLEIIAAGADDYLGKPFAARELIARVGAHLATARVRRRAVEEAHAEATDAIAARHAAEARLARIEERIHEAQRMEATGMLAGGVLHEVNNMMTAIIGFGELAIAEIDAREAIHGDVAEMLRAARRAAGVTEQFVAFGMQRMPKPEVLDVNAALVEIAKRLPRFLGADVDVAFRLSPVVGHVRVDRRQLEQVVVNLGLNARDAMPHGGRLTVRTEHVIIERKRTRRRRTSKLAPGSYALIEITDSGIGMDEATRLHAFEAFFTTKPAGFGTGLGLSAVLGMVQRWGGHIELGSTPGRGTRVQVYLRRVDEEDTSAARRAAAGAVDTILIVEDEALVRDLARRVLEHAGFDVLEASNGREALDVVGAEPERVQLVLSDLVMPELGGRDLGKLFKDRGFGFPVLYMTGYNGDHIARHALLDADAPYLQKPFAPECLIREVRALLAQSHRAPPRRW
jgi:signal transduction histidine kinase